MRRDVTFVLIQGCLYAAFLTLDLAVPGSGWDMPLKYLSILLCLLFVLRVGHGSDRALMGTALSFTLLADLFLLVLDRCYPMGVASFCVVQLLYLARILRTRPGAIPLRLALRALVTWAALTAVWILSALEPPTCLSLFYFAQLVCNAGDALTLGSRYRLFALGLLLFIGCDLCVGLQNLSAWLPQAPAPLLAFSRVGMWLFYLPSQVLLALSVKRK